MYPAIGLDPARAAVPAGAEPPAAGPAGAEPPVTGSAAAPAGAQPPAAAEPPAAGRPLSAFIDATHGTVQEALAVSEPEMGYIAIARLSTHLAAMWRAVYPCYGSQPGTDGQLRAACLRRARTVGWTLRLLECQLSGESSAVSMPAAAVSATLAGHLGSYRSAERALVSWIEDQLPAERRDRLALHYGRALTRAPTRPHPRCPRTGPLRCVAFWLYGRWDRLLDVMDSRPGVGRDFLVLTGHQDGAPERRPG